MRHILRHSLSEDLVILAKDGVFRGKASARAKSSSTGSQTSAAAQPWCPVPPARRVARQGPADRWGELKDIKDAKPFARSAMRTVSCSARTRSHLGAGAFRTSFCPNCDGENDRHDWTGNRQPVKRGFWRPTNAISVLSVPASLRAGMRTATELRSGYQGLRFLGGV